MRQYTVSSLVHVMACLFGAEPLLGLHCDFIEIEPFGKNLREIIKIQ